MKKLTALAIIALFLGGAGTGMGALFLYQIATGRLIGPEGPQGDDGTDGAPGPQQLSGLYEGDHTWGDAIVTANESVTLRNGNFYGTALYVYGNLTMENVNLYQPIWPLGNSYTTFNNSKWLGTPADTNYWIFQLLVYENASVVFLGDVGFIETGVLFFRVRTADRSAVSLINTTICYEVLTGSEVLGCNFDIRGQSELLLENCPPMYMAINAYENASVSLRNVTLLGSSGRQDSKFFGNSSLDAWNVTYQSSPYPRFYFYDTASAVIRNSSFYKTDPHGNSSITLWDYSDIKEVYAYDYSTFTLRTNSAITDRLDAWNYFTGYRYASEGCTINAENLYDSAQVFVL